ncbi:MAG: class I SAM-dependent methyltransferase [Ignavibacteriaceae bacterium]|jgi:SAM-dependent methyltransferase|nr:class I SAM-dependent methyltransferase [Ignavibacteriaceae bacterium]
MKQNWEERYGSSDYVYGVEPNDYFRQELSKLKPGMLLLLGEGEGRNATFASKNGWSVDAVDWSEEARNKAHRLSRSHNVIFNYIVADITQYTPDTEKFDAVALIYIHLPEYERQELFKKIFNALKPGGKLILEAFDIDQIKYKSGGPSSPDLLYSLEDIVELCIDYNFDNISKEVIQLSEGRLHKGDAAVIRFTGTKP